ncbi:MAG: thioredoxin family protein [Gammaproteobacteria bacterium]|nr:thioredoxin family protein [Gammaproteobacteria bacterium]
MVLRIDLYYAPFCGHCASVKRRLRAIAASNAEEIAYRELDVLNQLDAAVALRIRATPALVINGKLAASGALGPRRLRELLAPYRETLHDEAIHDQ